MADKFPKKLRMAQELDPFHWNYDLEKLKELLLCYDQADSSFNHVGLCVASFVFNSYYTDLQNRLRAILGPTSSIDTKMSALFSIFNRNHIIAHEMLVGGNEDVYLQDVNAWTISSVDRSIGDVVLQSAIETDIDALNLCCNIFRYNQKSIDDSRFPENRHSTINLGIEAYYMATMNCVLKEVYECVIWGDGEFDLSENKKSIVAKVHNKEVALAHKVGHYRMQSNSLNHYFLFKEALEKGHFIGKIIEGLFMKTKKIRS